MSFESTNNIINISIILGRLFVFLVLYVAFYMSASACRVALDLFLHQTIWILILRKREQKSCNFCSSSTFFFGDIINIMVKDFMLNGETQEKYTLIPGKYRRSIYISALPLINTS